MTEPYRAVVDTNVVIAAYRSRSPRSPTQELLMRWQHGEFILMYSRQIRQEYIRKLRELDLDRQRIVEFNDAVLRHGIRVPILAQQIKPVTSDPTDNIFVACAVVGNATHLVTYDPHIQRLGRVYHGVQIVEALEFLYLVRSDRPPYSS